MTRERHTMALASAAPLGGTVCAADEGAEPTLIMRARVPSEVQ